MNKELEKIKEIINDGVITINDRDYKLVPTTHERRIKVFAFFTKFQNELQTGNFSFLVDKDFKEVEKNITDMILFEDMTLTKLPTHWDKYSEDYILLITTMFMVVSFPFLKGNLISSQA